jgi:hypothetical protein
MQQCIPEVFLGAFPSLTSIEGNRLLRPCNP